MNEIGYIPPQAIDIEDSLLGMILISGASFDLELFKPVAFYNEKNKTIAIVLSEMIDREQNIDLLSVAEILKKKDKFEAIGGSAYLTNLIQKVEPSGDIVFYEKIILEKYISREIIRITNEVSRKAFSGGDPFELASDLLAQTSNLIGFKSESVHHVREAMKELYQLIDKNISGKSKLTGIPSGLIEVDRFTNGWQKSDLIIIGGEPSNGKTSFALKCAVTPAMTGHKVLIYSYEMSEIQLAARLTAMESGFSAKKIQYRKLENYELEQINPAIRKIVDMELYIDNISDSSLKYLERSIRVMVQKNGMELIIIDYLQLIRHSIKGGNHTEAVAEIANHLKELARILDVPIILVSQLARDKPNPKPTITRLKGSGDIEAAADIIIMPWIPENYGITQFECRGETFQSAGLAHLNFGKGRNIGITEMVLRFQKETTLFLDYEREQYTEIIPY